MNVFFIPRGTPSIHDGGGGGGPTELLIAEPNIYTVEPLLSGYPRGNDEWPLNRRLSLNQ